MGDLGKGRFREAGKEGGGGGWRSEYEGEAETAVGRTVMAGGASGQGSSLTEKGQERDRETESEDQGDQAVVGAVPKALGGTVLERRRHWLQAVQDASTDGLTQDNSRRGGAPLPGLPNSKWCCCEKSRGGWGLREKKQRTSKGKGS